MYESNLPAHQVSHLQDDIDSILPAQIGTSAPDTVWQGPTSLLGFRCPHSEVLNRGVNGLPYIQYGRTVSSTSLEHSKLVS